MTHGNDRMTAERFSALIGAYGANPERWPEDECESALAFCKGSAEAQAEIERAAALDGLLDAARPDIAASEDLRDRIALFVPQRAGTRSLPLWQRVLPSGASWQRIAATAVVGVAVGILFAEFGLPHRPDSSDPTAAAVTVPAGPGLLAAEMEAPVTVIGTSSGIALAPDLAAVSFTGGDVPSAASPAPEVTRLFDDGIGSVADLPLL